jgi:hypothetical protein
MSQTYLIVDKQGDVLAGRAWLQDNVRDVIIQSADTVMGVGVYVLKIKRHDLEAVRERFKTLLLT